MNEPDFTAIADPVLRERTELGHHPRRELVTAYPLSTKVVGDPSGWYVCNGFQLYRASDQLLYRVDRTDGLFQITKCDLRPDSDSHGVKSFGPTLRTWLGAKTLVEADAHKQTKEAR